MSTTTETQERVREIVDAAVQRFQIGPRSEDIGRATARQACSDLAAAGLLRGDDDLPAGLRERCRRWIATAPLESPTGEVMREHDALLRALTVGESANVPTCWPAGESVASGPAGTRNAGEPSSMALPRRMQPNRAEVSWPHEDEHDETPGCIMDPPCQPVAPKPRRMWGNPKTTHTHNREHDEMATCADYPPCQPVAEPAPVEDRPLVVGDVIDFIDEHGNEWTRSRRVEAWLAATPAPCRHPGAVAVETVVDHSILTSTGRVVERVTALYCPGCGARIAVPQEVSHG